MPYRYNTRTTYEEKVLKPKMPVTDILISQQGSSSNSPNASLVFHGQEYDLSAYMNQQGGGDVNINISDKGVRIVSKKKRQYFQNATAPEKVQHSQTVAVAETEQQHFQTVPVAEAEQQQYFQAVPAAEAEQKNHFQTVLVAEKQQYLWTVPVAIAGAIIVSFLHSRWI